MQDLQKQLKIDFAIRELITLGGLDQIMKDVHLSLFEKMMNAPTMDAHQELYYVIKSLKEVESILTESTNRADSHLQDTI